MEIVGNGLVLDNHGGEGVESQIGQKRQDKGFWVGESIQEELIGLRDRFDLPYYFGFEEKINLKGDRL